MKSAMAIQCVPHTDRPREEVYRIVDKAIEVLDKSGLNYTVGPMETVVEGPLDTLIELAKAAHQAVLDQGVGRVSTHIKLVSGAELGSSEEKVAKYRAQGH